MAENHVLLETITLSQNASSVTFDNIPQMGYTDLKIVAAIKTSRSVITGNMTVNFNGVTTNLSSRILRGLDTSPNTYSTTSAIEFSATGSTSSSTNTWGNAEIYVPNYLSSNFKTVNIESVIEANEANQFNYFTAGLWSATNAITSITITTKDAGQTLLADSTFSLYGIAALNTTPTLAPLATGGNIVANDGTYWYHAFTSSGNFVPQTNLTCDTLVIAGGGGGGGAGQGIGGGGGAGGLRSLASQSFTGGVFYAANIGAGGVGGFTTSGNYIGFNGSNSSLIGGGLSISATGGGRGGAANGSPLTPLTGGSGGGASNQNQDGAVGNAGGYSPVEGYKGGNGNATGDNAGGGAGAGANGANGVAPRSAGGGAGGAGVNTYSAWGTATNTGVSGYYAGGGGGGGYYDGAASAGGAGGGGTGGGGTGSSNIPAGSATRNTGSGGGGAGNYNTWTIYNAGSGGSGIVIIRYAMV